MCSVNSSIQKRHRSESQARFLFWGLLTCILLLLELDPGGWAGGDSRGKHSVGCRTLLHSVGCIVWVAELFCDIRGWRIQEVG